MNRLTRWFVVGCLAVCTAAGAQTATTANPAPALSEVQRLKAENLKLQFALLQQQEAQLREAAAKLEAQRVALETEFRTTLRAPDGSAFNWNTYSFDKPQTVGAATGAAVPKNDDKELK